MKLVQPTAARRVAGALVFVLLVLWAAAPIPVSQTASAPMNDAAKYTFGDTRSVGQTFQPLPGLTAIDISVTFDNDEFSGPLLLHIRKDYFGSDIRSAVVFRQESKPIRFTFEPLYTTERLVWVLEAPNDPDHTYSVFREIDDTAELGAVAFVKGREIPGNFAATQIGSITTLENFLSNQQPHGTSKQLDGWLVAGLLVTIAVIGRRRQWLFLLNRYPGLTLGLIVLLSFGAHMAYAHVLPLVNDEGTYLQDVVQWTGDFWPFRDYLTKGPLYIVLLRAWTAIVPHDPVLLRGLSALAWAGGSAILYFLIRGLRGSRTQAIAGSFLMALSPGAVVVTTPLLLQVVSTVIGLAALVLVVQGCQAKRAGLIAIGAALVVAAYFTRASSAMLAFVGLGLIILLTGGWRQRALASYVGTGAGITVGVALISWLVIGFEQTMVMLNLEALIIAQDGGQVLAAQADTAIRQVIEGARMLWRGAPWLIAGALIGILVLIRHRSVGLRIALSGLFVTGMLVVFRNWADMGYLMPTQNTLGVISAGLLVFVLPALLSLMQAQAPALPPVSRSNRAMILVSLGWIGLLAFVYSQWFRFIDSYIIEFIPPLAILTVAATTAAWPLVRNHPRLRAAVPSVVVLLVLVSTVSSIPMLMSHPHTGTLDLTTTRSVRELIQRVVPVGQEVFTAQVALTSLAQRPVIFGYSHSGWYLYEQVGLVATPLRQLFFDEPERVTQYLADEAQFVLVDKRTWEVYFAAFPDRQRLLQERFELTAEIENPGEDTIRLYHRIN